VTPAHTGVCLDTEEKHQPSVRLIGVSTEIRTRYLRNKRQKRYSLNELVRLKSGNDAGMWRPEDGIFHSRRRENLESYNCR
jgi:hypothetical protein